MVMKKLETGLLLNFIALLTIASLLNTGFYTYEAAGRAHARKDSTRIHSAGTSEQLAVAIFQMENSLKFKVVLENYTGKRVYVNITDKNNKVMHLEKVMATKYIRKFDMSSLEDGKYIIEVRGAGQRYTKEVLLQTKVARLATTHETPLTQIAENRVRNQKNIR
jgi:hypothetical protein